MAVVKRRVCKGDQSTAVEIQRVNQRRKHESLRYD